ncbi:MAG TPA: hypothetical protein ENN43_00580 [bacterium]|nr:hypothetical protein [bacterium]
MNLFFKRFVLTIIFALLLASLYPVSITVDTSQERAAISPYIYGTNQLMEGQENLTLYRLGGNRTSGYNWENNFSNAGNDWNHVSDTWLCSSSYNYGDDCSQPGGLLRRFHQESLDAGMRSIITVQMAGYVSADNAGTVTLAETAPSSRWKQVVAKKGSAFAYPPDLTDDYVYIDEAVNYLVSHFGLSSTQNGVKSYALDNEPGLWSSTHPRIHPDKCGAVELITRSVDTAKAIKDVDPGAEIFGPMFFGFWAMNNFQDPPDWASEKGSFQWYVDYYLAKMKEASDADGRRLLDVFSFHLYSEAREGLAPPYTYESGACRITLGNCNTNDARIARMQAPRTLWDASYRENSSVAQWFSWSLPIIPKVQASINTHYPGTKLALTEYNHGGGNDYSGGISMADTLGIFGKYGVYAAAMWKTAYGPFHSAAFRLFRNYDGENSVYGNTKVKCDSDDIFNMTSYASIHGTDESKLHIIVLNKAPSAQTANISITSSEAYTGAEVWGFGGDSHLITRRASAAITGNAFNYSVPAHSALHFVIGTQEVPVTPVTPVDSSVLRVTRSVIYPSPLKISEAGSFKASFSVSAAISAARLRLYNLNMELVLEASFKGEKPAGGHTEEVDLSRLESLASGIYIYVVDVEGEKGEKASSRPQVMAVIK